MNEAQLPSASTGRRSFALVFLLATFAIAARLLLQLAALPPYAGLDEVYHVARLAFVAHQGRNPTSSENSVPAYLDDSMAARPDAPPAFGVVGEHWRQVVAGRTVPVAHERFIAPRSNAWSYLYRNYEAQQPSLYYTVTAFAGDLSGGTGELAALRRWRLVSLFWALVTCCAIAFIGYRRLGLAGLLAGVLVSAFPTWETLVVRASNDAMACALMAVGVALTLEGSRQGSGPALSWIAEAAVWALAAATKLYSWPLLVALPIIWFWQRADVRRMAIVSAGVLAALVATGLELKQRTGNLLGLFVFDGPNHTAAMHGTPAIDYAGMLKVTLASAAWTSGQYGNALRPAAMALYLAPLLLAMLLALVLEGPKLPRALSVCAAVLLAFGVAQCVTALGYIRLARAAGLALPAGGKEGWYWYTLAPLWVLLVGLAMITLRPPLAALLVAWMVGWDLLITEGALFQDFAGLTDGAHGDWIFRWGPRQLALIPDLGRRLSGIAVGPMTASLPGLRLLQLASIAALAVVALKKRVTPRDIQTRWTA